MKVKKSKWLVITLAVFMFLFLVPALGGANDSSDSPIVWTGQGKGSINCEEYEQGTMHWVLNQARNVESPVLVLYDKGGNELDRDDDPRMTGPVYHFYTGYYDLDNLEAKVFFDGTLAKNPRGRITSQFVLSGYCPPDIVIYPESGTTTVAYEDLPLGGSDWDYNDWVATIETVGTFQGMAGVRHLTTMEFDITPKARGAAAQHVFGIVIPEGTFSIDGTYMLVKFDGDGNEVSTDTGAFDASEDENFVIWQQTSTVLPNMSNTEVGQAPVAPNQTAKLSIVFNGNGCGLFNFSDYPEEDIGFHGDGLFFEPYIISDRVTEDIGVGDIRMLVVPDDWRWPKEKVSIWNAYVEVVEEAGFPKFVPEWWGLGFVDNLVY